MSVPITYTTVEWQALVGLVRRPRVPELAEPDLPARIVNAIGRGWLTHQREITLEVAEEDANVLTALRAGLPDIDVLSAIAEAEQIVREHARRFHR